MSASSEARAALRSATAAATTATTAVPATTTGDTPAPATGSGPGPGATPPEHTAGNPGPDSGTSTSTSEDTVAIPVVLPADLHARPAGRLARAAAEFAGSSLVLQFGERSADPRGVLAVMALGATAGRTVVVRAQGPDAREAAESLAEILATAR